MHGVHAPIPHYHSLLTIYQLLQYRAHLVNHRELSHAAQTYGAWTGVEAGRGRIRRAVYADGRHPQRRCQMGEPCIHARAAASARQNPGKFIQCQGRRYDRAGRLCGQPQTARVFNCIAPGQQTGKSFFPELRSKLQPRRLRP